jgi:hypothetical protein
MMTWPFSKRNRPQPPPYLSFPSTHRRVWSHACHPRRTHPRSVTPSARPVRSADSLLPHLLLAPLLHDIPIPPAAHVDLVVQFLRSLAVAAAARPIVAADLEQAKANATVDEGVFTLSLFPDVLGCADSCRLWSH